MGELFLKADELRVVIRNTGFRVDALAVYIGMDVRTLERHFCKQFRVTPKAWIMRERISIALPLLAEGLSNKQVAGSPWATLASQTFAVTSNDALAARRRSSHASTGQLPPMSRFDRELS